MSSLFACLRSARDAIGAFEIARDFSPRVQRHAPGCVVLDVSGLGSLLGDADAIGMELHRAVAEGNRAITVAVAPTQSGAMLLSVAGDALTVVTADIAAALSDLPLTHLQQLLAEIHGVAILRPRPARLRKEPLATPSSAWPAWDSCERAFDVLRRWGLETMGELASLGAADLSARLSLTGVVLQQLSRGIDLRPLVPDPEVQRFVERMALEWPIDRLEPLSFVLARLLDPLSTALERADRGAVAVRLDLRLVDRTTFTRTLPLPAPMRDARVLRTLVLLDLESHPPPAAIDTVTIEIDPAPGRVVQYSLLERALPTVETLTTLTARLGALVGESRCGTPALMDTHRPDGFEMQRFDPVPSRGLPVQLIVAATSREPSRVVPVLRRFRPPVPVRVAVERGRPIRVAIDRRGMPGGQVIQAAGPWRTSGAWWDRPTHWARDEWDVAMSDGTVCRLLDEGGQWAMEAIID
jgi:protein ImuB